MRLETLLRDSGKGDTELKAELAKLKAENRSLKVQLSKAGLIIRASIMNYSPSHEEAFHTERIVTLHPLHIERSLPIQAPPPQAQMLRHHNQHNVIHLMKNDGYCASKNLKPG